jgi:hypothetical protein
VEAAIEDEGPTWLLMCMQMVTHVVVHAVPLHAHRKPIWSYFHRHGLYRVIINYNIFRYDGFQLSQKRILLIMLNHHVVVIRD